MQRNRYSVVAHYTRDLVYERIAPRLLQELEEKTPKNEKGHRPNKLHQWRTEDVVNPFPHHLRLGAPGGFSSSRVGYRPALSWNIRNIFVMFQSSPFVNTSTICSRLNGKDSPPESQARRYAAIAVLSSASISAMIFVPYNPLPWGELMESYIQTYGNGAM